MPLSSGHVHRYRLGSPLHRNSPLFRETFCALRFCPGVCALALLRCFARSYTTPTALPPATLLPTHRRQKDGLTPLPALLPQKPAGGRGHARGGRRFPEHLTGPLRRLAAAGDCGRRRFGRWFELCATRSGAGMNAVWFGARCFFTTTLVPLVSVGRNFKDSPTLIEFCFGRFHPDLEP